MPTLQTRNHLPEFISQKIERLRTAVDNRIASGFMSDALGTAHFYPSSTDDRIALIGAANTGQSRTFPCVPEGQDPTDPANWIAPEHTNTELNLVMNDGADLIQILKNDYRTRVTTALASANENELNAIDENF